MPETPLLAVEGLTKTFLTTRGLLSRGHHVTHAVRDVSFTLPAAGSLGIVGESGSGKTTIARMLVGLETPSGGRILYEGRDAAAAAADRRRARRPIQMVFQDPYTSLDPRQSVRRALDEVQRVHFTRSRAERDARTMKLLDAVGLGAREADALPRRLSGGQRQRAAIARALAAEPEVLVLDEAVSSLDVSIQSQILNLLVDLRAELRLTYVFISHDIAVIRHISDNALVMYRGRVLEQGPVHDVLVSPANPYTQSLIGAVPRPGMSLARERSTGPVYPDGCAFSTRCPHVFDRCCAEPPLLTVRSSHDSRCWLMDKPRKEAA